MTTRRGFIQGIGVGMAALVLPKAVDTEAKTGIAILPYKANCNAAEKIE